ncbi:MAG: lysylphosphatidylglycerol synthase transmembrane domain-containing protein [Gaiellaceae bacterium]
MRQLAGNPWVRAAAVLVALVGTAVLIYWRGPEWGAVVDAFRAVEVRWVVAAVIFNLLSAVTRALAWQTVIHQAMPDNPPPFSRTFSAFGIGLLANAVLPGRIGELARVGVLTRKMPGEEGATATLLGTVFAHRVFDLIPSLLLIAYVLLTAKIPHWAITSLVLVAGIGLVMFVFAIVSGRIHVTRSLDELGTVRRLLAMARRGLSVMRNPLAALLAICLQILGWFWQLLAVYTAMRAFDIHEPLPAAALVLLLMNVATIFPLWPGNVGLLQAAVALPLVSYGVPYAQGFAFGIGLQAIEMSVGVSVGFIFLAREGISFAVLRRMQADETHAAEELIDEELEREAVGAGTRV